MILSICIFSVLKHEKVRTIGTDYDTNYDILDLEQYRNILIISINDSFF